MDLTSTGLWIRIKTGKMKHKNRKVKKYHVLKCRMFSLESSRLPLQLRSPSRKPKNKYCKFRYCTKLEFIGIFKFQLTFLQFYLSKLWIWGSRLITKPGSRSGFNEIRSAKLVIKKEVEDILGQELKYQVQYLAYLVRRASCLAGTEPLFPSVVFQT